MLIKLKNNLSEILKTINSKAKLMAVTKTVDTQTIKALYDLGLRDFGENRVSDLAEKAESLKNLEGIRWHFIGKLQRKKVKSLFVIPHLFAIHSVDSLKLAAELNNRAGLLDHEVKLFFQVNTSGEDQKSGFADQAEVLAAIKEVQHKKLLITGLMTMAGIRSDDQIAEAKKCFIKLKEIKKSLNMDELELSMGMSQDFEVALEVGTNWLRIGSKLYR